MAHWFNKFWETKGVRFPKNRIIMTVISHSILVVVCCCIRTLLSGPSILIQNSTEYLSHFLYLRMKWAVFSDRLCRRAFAFITGFLGKVFGTTVKLDSLDKFDFSSAEWEQDNELTIVLEIFDLDGSVRSENRNSNWLIDILLISELRALDSLKIIRCRMKKTLALKSSSRIVA